MIIKLVRHGQSKANTGEANPQEVGDYTIPLTSLGEQQARAVGERVGAEFVRNALVYTSPYRRTRQTLAGLLAGAGGDSDAAPAPSSDSSTKPEVKSEGKSKGKKAVA